MILSIIILTLKTISSEINLIFELSTQPICFGESFANLTKYALSIKDLSITYFSKNNKNKNNIILKIYYE